MDAEMRKRLEEAAEGTYPIAEVYNDLYMEFVDANGDLREAFREGGEVGAELGYKEAIRQAREWMKKRIPCIHTREGDAIYVHGFRHIPMSSFIADFEADMNKLWEGNL